MTSARFTASDQSLRQRRRSAESSAPAQRDGICGCLTGIGARRDRDPAPVGLRVLTAAVTLLLVSAIVFAAVEILPGDVAANVLGQFSSETRANALREQLHLDRAAAAALFPVAWRAAARRSRHCAQQPPPYQRHLVAAHLQHSHPLGCGDSSSTSRWLCFPPWRRRSIAIVRRSRAFDGDARARFDSRFSARAASSRPFCRHIAPVAGSLHRSTNLPISLDGCAPWSCLHPRLPS